MTTLKQKTVLVVGGGSGLGLAVARLARDQGARVIVASRRAAERLDAAPGGGDLQALAFDIGAGQGAVQALFDTVGEIDHLVVAVRPAITPAPLAQVDEAEARRAFDIKFWGQYRLARAASERLRDGGSIVLTSGIAGERIYPGMSTMALINGATETLCRMLAVELAPLRVNAVSPGFLAPKPAKVEAAAQHFPLPRLGAVEEVAEVYLHLMRSGYATGTVSVVDGGARLL
ncbi:short-chain dehydrogenase [Alcanivorax sp. N3-2A]|nr:short-chain dehydrogenase [Alcanivorax sp. N3-2A]|tara:strand:- start:80207 stop:80899 length:693 start_codon:yes stop_codon:yes gene_type:complete